MRNRYAAYTGADGLVVGIKDGNSQEADEKVQPLLRYAEDFEKDYNGLMRYGRTEPFPCRSKRR